VFYHRFQLFVTDWHNEPVPPSEGNAEGMLTGLQSKKHKWWQLPATIRAHFKGLTYALRHPFWTVEALDEARQGGLNRVQHIPVYVNETPAMIYAALQPLIPHDGVLWLPNSMSEWHAFTDFYSLPPETPHRFVHNAFGPLPEPSNEETKNAESLGDFILVSGRIERRKNQYLLLKALEEYPSIKLVFAGKATDVEYARIVKHLAEKRGNTIFLGHVQPTTLTALYRKARVHALPSFHETPGISNLEAIASGCWNVGTSMGGLMEYVGKHSLYANPYSIDDIREKVLLAWEMSRTGRNEAGAQIAQSYTW